MRVKERNFVQFWLGLESRDWRDVADALRSLAREVEIREEIPQDITYAPGCNGFSYPALAAYFES